MRSRLFGDRHEVAGCDNLRLVDRVLDCLY